MTDREIAEAVNRASIRCREVVDGCIFEFEWKDVEEEFAAIIADEIKGLIGGQHGDR